MNTRLAEQMADLCDQAGCKEKIAKLHFDQALRNWHSHPPKAFESWWASKPRTEVAKTAYNCELYRKQYLEVRDIGAV